MHFISSRRIPKDPFVRQSLFLVFISPRTGLDPGWMSIVPMTVCFLLLLILSQYHMAEIFQGLLLPNEKATINFTAHVDNDSASKLNFVSRNIEYTLILHTALGQDYFITATGEYRE